MDDYQRLEKIGEGKSIQFSAAFESKLANTGE